MKPRKALTASISAMKENVLHILVTQEDGVIVARCLDFSVSSHGETEQDALDALRDSILDYLDYAIQCGAYAEIFDPEEAVFWKMFQLLLITHVRRNHR